MMMMLPYFFGPSRIRNTERKVALPIILYFANIEKLGLFTAWLTVWRTIWIPLVFLI